MVAVGGGWGGGGGGGGWGGGGGGGGGEDSRFLQRCTHLIRGLQPRGRPLECIAVPSRGEGQRRSAQLQGDGREQNGGRERGEGMEKAAGRWKRVNHSHYSQRLPTRPRHKLRGGTIRDSGMSSHWRRPTAPANKATAPPSTSKNVKTLQLDVNNDDASNSSHALDGQTGTFDWLR